MNLQTEYLGLSLKHPVMPGASPLVDDLGVVRRLEDSGASAIVMHSLFEEQIDLDRMAMVRHIERFEESFSEATDFFPEPMEFRLGPEEYLEHIRRIKEVVEVPVIASLNGTQVGGWVDYARLIEQAGADALELNTYMLATDAATSGDEVEKRLLEVVRAVKDEVTIPIAVKLSPYFSSLSHFARQIEVSGASGLVLFNRFYQPDIDVDELHIVPRLELSNPEELRLRLRWLAILSGQLSISLAASGGVHSGDDVVKAILTGAHAVQTVSALLKIQPEHIGFLIHQLEVWMEEQEYESVTQMRGALAYQKCPDPGAIERANYLRVLQLWR